MCVCCCFFLFFRWLFAEICFYKPWFVLKLIYLHCPLFSFVDCRAISVGQGQEIHARKLVGQFMQTVRDIVTAVSKTGKRFVKNFWWKRYQRYFLWIKRFLSMNAVFTHRYEWISSKAILIQMFGMSGWMGAPSELSPWFGVHGWVVRHCCGCGASSWFF